MNPVQNKQFNIIEPPVTLTLTPLNQIACALAQGDVQAAINCYNDLDAETQNRLNTLCKKLNKETPSVGGPSQLSKRGLSVGDLSSVTFIELLSDTSRCLSRPQKKAQISVLQQVIATVQSPDFVEMKSIETGSKSATLDNAVEQIFHNNVVDCTLYTGEDLFDALPTEIRASIISECSGDRDARALACTSSFFRRCLWQLRMHFVANELNSVNTFWGGTIATLPEASQIESEERLRTVTHNTLVKLTQFFLRSNPERLSQQCDQISRPSFAPSIVSPLQWFVFHSCELLCSEDLNPRQIAEKVDAFFQAGLGQCAYQMCWHSRSICGLGPNGRATDISALSTVVKALLRHNAPISQEWPASQLQLALQFVNQEPIELLKIQMLLDNLLEDGDNGSLLIERGHSELVFDSVCKMPPSKKADALFEYIILYALRSNNCESDLVMRSVEKISDKTRQRACLHRIVTKLLEEGKGAKALLIAPRITRDNTTPSRLWVLTWKDLVNYVMHLNVTQAFAIAYQLDITIPEHREVASNLAVLLIKGGEDEKASYLTTKIKEYAHDADFNWHLESVAAAFAKKKKWEAFEDVALQLIDAGGHNHIANIISDLLFLPHLEYDQFEKFLFLAKKFKNPSSSSSTQKFIIERVASKGQWEEAMTLLSKIEDDVLREYILKVLLARPGCPYSSNATEEAAKP